MRYLICQAEPRAWGVIALDPQLTPDLATAVGAARAAHARCRNFEELIVVATLACAFYRDDVLHPASVPTKLPYWLLDETFQPDQHAAMTVGRAYTAVSWANDKFHVSARAELFVAPTLVVRTAPIPWESLKGLITVHGRTPATSA